VSERARAHAALFELLERRHGIGVRSAGLPAWAVARLDRALDALSGQTGSIEAAIELCKSDPAKLAELADLLRVGETSFFRDPPQWEALRRAVVPRFAERERLRAVSVGCSTGEEAWTLAMLLAEAGGAERSVRVVGIDRSEPALRAAREGVYPRAAARHVPGDLASRFLETDGESVRVSAELRASVTFVERDAMLGPPPGSYELAVCKNVLIYFGDDGAARVVELLLRSLADGGVLVVARSEIPRVRALGARPEELAPGITVFRA
jgi:chemotaxis methyl-accepting protein methylase